MSPPVWLFILKIKKYWVLTKRFYLHIGVWYVDGEDESITRRNRASCMLFSTWPITKINQFSSMENSSTRFKVIAIQAWSRNGQRINGNDWSSSVWTLPSFFFFLLQVDWIYKAIMASILKLKRQCNRQAKYSKQDRRSSLPRTDCVQVLGNVIYTCKASGCSFVKGCLLCKI